MTGYHEYEDIPQIPKPAASPYVTGYEQSILAAAQLWEKMNQAQQDNIKNYNPDDIVDGTVVEEGHELEP